MMSRILDKAVYITTAHAEGAAADMQGITILLYIFVGRFHILLEIFDLRVVAASA